MRYFKKQQIIDFFSILNNAGVEYILLRNINNELPTKLSVNKDIDLIIIEEDLHLLQVSLIQNNWREIPHPHHALPFLYNMCPFKFYEKEGLHIDICCQLCCRSLNNGEFFPLDMQIQRDIWLNKIATSNTPWKYRLSIEDEFLHLITRCIFDKKRFEEEYIKEINCLFTKCNKSVILDKFEIVFFKFSKNLIKLIESELFNEIIDSYLKFQEY